MIKRTHVERLCRLSIFLLLVLAPAKLMAQEDEPDPTLLMQKGDSLREYGKYQLSERLYKKALQKYRASNNPVEKRRAIYKLSLSLLNAGQWDSARTFFNRAKQISRSHTAADSTLVPLFYYLKGSLARADSDNERAKSIYKRGLDFVQNHSEYSKWEPRYYLSLGNAYKKSDSLDKALHFYNRALISSRKIYRQSHPDAAIAQNNLAAIYYLRGANQKAISLFKQASEKIPEYYGEEQVEAAMVYQNLGITYSEVGNSEKAIHYLEQSLSIEKELPGIYENDTATAFQNISSIYQDLGRFDLAIKNYKRAEKAYQKGSKPGYSRLVTLNIGSNLSENSNFDKAAANYLENLKINLDKQDYARSMIGDIYLKIGRSFFLIENFEEAITYFNKAISIYSVDSESRPKNNSVRDLLYPSAMLKALSYKAEALRKIATESSRLDTAKQALKIYKKATDLVLELQHALRTNRAKFILRKQTNDIYKKGFEIAYQLYKESGNEVYKNEALSFVVENQNHILLDYLLEDNARSYANLPDSLLVHENRLRKRITGIQKKISAANDQDQPIDTVRYEQFRDSLLQAEENFRNHVEYLESHFPKYFKFKYSSASLSARAIQKHILNRKQTLIQYYHSSNALYAFVISKKRFEIQNLGDASHLHEQIQRYRNEIMKSDSPVGFMRESSGLYDLLIELISDQLGTKKLIVIPDDHLFYVPFESLTKSQKGKSKKYSYSNLPYLVNEYEIKYAPSLRYLNFCERLESIRNNRVFLGIAPVFSSGNASEKRIIKKDSLEININSLPFSGSEVKRIGKILGNRRGVWSFLSGYKPIVDVFTDTTATENRFKNLPLDDYRFIHIASHAFTPGDNFDSGGIVFAQSAGNDEDGILHVSEIFNLDFNSKLVTLSACETGIGRIAEGEGMMSISRAFQYAGARNLLVSLWSIDDRATFKMMVDFYTLYHRGKSFSAALQSAKQRMIQNKKFANPKYWSAFILIGQ